MKIIFTCLLLVSINYSNAQNTFNLINVSSESASKASIFSYIIGNNNVEYVLGTTQDSLYIGSSAYSCNGKNIFISQITQQGNVNWSKFIKYNTNVKTASLVKDISGNVYVTAVVHDGLEANGQTYNWSGYKYAVIKYDATGNFQWITTMHTNPALAYAPTVCIGNNELILVVTAKDSLIANAQNLSFNDNDLKICVVRMDLSGQVNNIIPIEGTGDVVTVVGNPIVTPGNELILACKVFNGDTLYVNGNVLTGSTNAQSGFFIIKTDLFLSNIIAKTFVTTSRFANTNHTSNVMSASVSPTGALYLAGTFVDTLSAGSFVINNLNNPNPVGLTDNFLLALDKNFQAKWLKHIGNQNNNDWISGVEASNNGNLYIAGNASDNINIGSQTINVPSNHVECYVANLDTNGVLLNSKFSGSLAPFNAGHAIPYGLNILFNGEILVFGSTNSDIVFESDTLFRKSIQSGFVWHTTFTPTGIRILENNAKTFNNVIYPNPVINDLYIKFILREEKQLKIQIVNVLGNALYRIPLQNYSEGDHIIHLPFSNVPSGSYICQIIDSENVIIDTSKIIKE